MDDLFGDLPAAKNSAPSENNAASASTNAAAPSGVGASLPESNRSAPPKSKSDEPKQTKPAPSLVTQLGTAGTSMAFVPQALRKKKRPPQQPAKKVEEKRQRAEGDGQNETDASKAVESDHADGFPLADIEIHDETDEPISSHRSSNQGEVADDDEGDPGEPYLENEPPSLRALHAAAKTSLAPYNPHSPNDYLAYRERKKTAAVRRDMQAAALAKLEAHDRLRKRVEEERRRIELSGDVDKIVESRLGAGRGRGRAMSNLPAWLIKKQQEEKGGLGGGAAESEKGGLGGGAAESEKGQFDDADSGKGCTISLLNMVAPGRIDNELSLEVREECGRIGKVLDVDVVDANSNQEHVRVDVTFDSDKSALEAIKVFDGRLFRERRIIANMVEKR